MTELKFYYEPTTIIDPNVDLYLELAKEYRVANPWPAIPGFEAEVNLLCMHDMQGGEYQTVNDIREKLSDRLKPLLEPGLLQAENFGMRGATNFRVWVHGNHENFDFNITKLSGHTHPYGNPCNATPTDTYTILWPLRVTEPITDIVWGKWIEDMGSKVPSKIKVTASSKVIKQLDMYNRSDAFKAADIAAYHKWWDELRETEPTEEVRIKYPEPGQQLTLDFDSNNWLHGVDNIGNNLYLIMLFDRYKK